MKHKKMIIAAANVFMVTKPDGTTQKLITPDNCHYGKNMREVANLLRDLGCEVKMDRFHDDTAGEGFIDESGIYHDRTQAIKIVKSSGQQFNPEYELPEGLDSSCIRHFPEDINFSDMCDNFLPEKCCMRMEMIGECDCGSS